MNKIIITAEPDTLAVYLKKIWQHRFLILVFAKRDLKIKYAQTALGLGWTIVQPLTAVVVFSLFFSLLMKFQSGYPYLLFVLSGVMVWNLFNYIFSQSSTSLMNNQDIVKKMNFPKILLPVSKVLVALVELGVTFILFLILMTVFLPHFKWQMPFGVFIIAGVVVFALGLSLTVSAATIKFRDLHHIVPFLVNFGIWFTPVFYPVSIIPAKWSALIYLNPMASFVQLFRVCFLPEPFHPAMLMGIPVALVIFTIGFFYFKKVEDSIMGEI